ncbi:MAG TPA: LysM domain-containing protein [Thermomicrobiales bacterium]|nr:LysM domain-containing protein [Thermomicrobiales bacterium]
MVKSAGLAFVTTLLLASCQENASEPTLEPAPTLPVVTATAGPPPVPTPGERQRYVVREGDTLSAIAARFGVSEEAILKENPLSDRDRLFVGQELVIPPAEP